MPDFSTLSDLRLVEAEGNVRDLYHAKPSPGPAAAHALITKEMRGRGLVYLPLKKVDLAKAAHGPARSNYSGNQVKNPTDEQELDAQGETSSTAEEGGNSEDRAPSEHQSPNGKHKVEDGPIVIKRTFPKGDSNSGPPNRGDHPSTSDGIHLPGSTKHGKGGEANRTQDDRAGDVDGDTDDENDGTLGIIHPLKKDSTDMDGVDEAAYEAFVICKAAGVATPHEFAPVRNVCRNCRQSGVGHNGDHDFVPVRDVCRTCKGGQAMHKSVALGYDYDLSIWKELPQLSNDDRMKMAEQGIALPDGSFPIPNEAFLHAMIGLVGQAPDPQSAMNHIIERAQAMGMEHALPAAWGVQGPNTPGQPASGPGAHALGDAGSANTPTTAPNAGPANGGGAASAGGPSGPAAASPSSSANGSATANSPTPSPASPATPTDPMAPKKKTAPSPGIMKNLPGSIDNPIDLTSFDEMVPFVKALTNEDDRYTLAPVYMPDQQDAHEEWATAEDLQKSMWDYVEKTGGDRNVYLQHSPTRRASGSTSSRGPSRLTPPCKSRWTG